MPPRSDLAVLRRIAFTDASGGLAWAAKVRALTELVEGSASRSAGRLRPERRKIVDAEAGSGRALEAAMTALKPLHALDDAAARPKRRVRTLDPAWIAPGGHLHAEPTSSAWRDLDASDLVKLRDGWKRRLAAPGPGHD